MNKFFCKKCGTKMVKNGKTTRKICDSDGEEWDVPVQRYLCKKCGITYQDNPDDILPYKHYDKDTLTKIQNGGIKESYNGGPSDTTVWRYKHFPLWKEEDNGRII